MSKSENKAQLTERRQEQILAVAKKIFAKNGFRRTQMEDIADALQIGKGTLYNYFDNKKSLFLAVYEQGMTKLCQTIRSILASITDPKQRKAVAVKIFFEFFEQDRELIEIQMQVRSEFKDDYRRMFLALYSDYIVDIQKNLQNGMGTGAFRQLDIESTSDAMSALTQGVLQNFYIREFGGSGKLTDKIEPVTRMILEGILKR